MRADSDVVALSRFLNRGMGRASYKDCIRLAWSALEEGIRSITIEFETIIAIKDTFCLVKVCPDIDAVAIVRGASGEGGINGQRKIAENLFIGYSLNKQLRHIVFKCESTIANRDGILLRVR